MKHEDLNLLIPIRHLMGIFYLTHTANAIKLDPLFATYNPLTQDHSMLNIPVRKPWENPECVGLNRLPARATLYPFQSEKSALTYNREKSTRVLSLNGEWDFRLVSHPDAAPDNFIDPKFKPSRGWKKITVPGNWTTHGRAVEHTSCRLGFRRVEVESRELLINGKPVLMKGVNRHDHHEHMGKTLDYDTCLAPLTSKTPITPATSLPATKLSSTSTTTNEASAVPAAAPTPWSNTAYNPEPSPSAIAYVLT
jgi:hypothetical protein